MIDIKKVQEEAIKAKQAGADPYQVDMRMAQYQKQADIESGVDSFEAEKNYIKTTGNYAIQYGKADPEAVTKRIEELDGELSTKQFIKEWPTVSKAVAGAKGVQQNFKNMGNDIARTFSDLMYQATDNPKYQKISQELKYQKKESIEKLKEDPYVKENPKSAAVGEFLGSMLLPGVGVASKAASIAKITAGAAATGGLYGFIQGEGDLADRAKSAALGATVSGLAGASLGALASKIDKSGQVAVSKPVLDNIAKQKSMGLNPGLARATEDLSSFQASKALTETPIGSLISSAGAKNIGNVEKGLPEYVDKVLKPKPKMSTDVALDMLDDAGNFPKSVDDIMSTWRGKMESVAGADDPLINPQGLTKLKAKINGFKKMLEKETTTDVRNDLIGAMDTTLNSTKNGLAFKDAWSLRTQIDSTWASTSKKVEGTMSKYSKDIQKAFRESIDEYADEASKKMGLGDQYKNFKDFSRRAMDYKEVANVLKHPDVYNPNLGGAFDVDKVVTKLGKMESKAYEKGKDAIGKEALDVVKGLKKVLVNYRLENKRATGKTQGLINKAIGGSLVGGAAAVLGAMGNPLIAGAIVLTGAAYKTVDYMLHNPTGLKMLQFVGRHPQGSKIAKDMAIGLSRVSGIEATKRD